MHQSVRKLIWIGVFVAFCVIVPCASFAQVNTGSISGTVVDSQKAVVGSADAKLTNLDTNKEYKTTSEANGEFRFTLLPRGNYRLEISKSAFRKLVIDPVVVNVGSDTGLGLLQLEVGEVSTSIEVTTAAPVVES